MDAQTLMQAMGGALSLARYQELLPAYEKMLRIVGAKTVTQCAMIAAQLGHESVGLKYQEEIASGAAYEGRRDLGNTQPGDGVRFKGHGWIQVTGRANHTTVSRWAHDRGIVPTPTFFVDSPKELGSDQYCWVGPAWYLTAARPGFMAAADRGDLETCTRMINGGLNGLADRRRRYQNALKLGVRLLPEGVNVAEKVLDYSRDQVTQDTFYNCGPASVQTIIQARTGKYVSESELGRELGTHRGGTDYIGSFPAVLNRHISGDYAHRDVPAYLDDAGKDVFWSHIIESINSGFGVVVNIVAPPSNYPRAVAPSTISPTYSGGTVYHYVAVMGWRDDGQRKVWVADSGFSPYGYWLSFDQLCTLVVPKGYAYSTIKTLTKNSGGNEVSFTEEDRKMLREVHHELTYRFQSRYRDENGVQSEYRETLVGHILDDNRKIENIHADILPWLIDVLVEVHEKVKGVEDGE